MAEGKKIGRPTKYKPEFCDKEYLVCCKGGTNQDLADTFNVNMTTVRDWRAKYEEFSTAIKEGKRIADQNVERSLYQRAMGYSHEDVHISNFQGVITITPLIKHYPPDPTSMIFWLKNRKPDKWRDKQEHILEAGESLAVLLAAARAKRSA